MNKYFEQVVDSRSRGKIINLKEIIQYFDLLRFMVKRDFVAQFKQTILGPIWFVLQPLLMTLTFSVIFGKVAGIGTDGVPKILFYLSGLLLWVFYSDILIKVSDMLISNQRIMSKVYFPRLIVPISIIISSLFKFAVQFAIFCFIYVWYVIKLDANIRFNSLVILVPIIVLVTGLLGLGFGLLFAALTSKYRDLKFLLSFGVQVLMYSTPIIYPLSSSEGLLKLLLLVNPLTGLMETFKYGLFDLGVFHVYLILYPFIFSFLLIVFALFVFSKYERNFIDTI